MRPAPNKPVIVLLPYAGGSACSFGELRARLMAHAHLVNIHYPGRGLSSGKGVCNTIQDMAHAVVSSIVNEGHEEVTLWGYSLGAIVAVEVMHQLAHMDHVCRVRHLVAAACRPPHLFHVHLPPGMPDEAFVATTARLGCLPKRLLNNPRVLSRLVPLLRADMEVAARYRYMHAPLSPVPITVLGGRGDPLVPLSDLAAWQEHTSVTCRQYVFGGDHFFIHQHLDEITQLLLDAASGFTCKMHSDCLPARFDSDALLAELIQ